jgi:hypothetical protein
MIYRCCNENRKAAVRLNPARNGIDYLEVLDGDAPAGVPRQQTLLIHCLNPLSSSLTVGPTNVGIEGGESIKAIAIDWVIAASAIDNTKPPDVAALLPVVSALANKANVLVVRTHVTGDFSTYRLRLVADAAHAATDPFAVTDVLPGFDPQLAEVEFCFKVECGPDFDCAPVAHCSTPEASPPPINYLAKDYGSFRTLLLDRIRQLLPGWGAASEADPGIALAELIAYVGDHLSYQQDAVATEAYLQTARRRVSLRRHALLVDYRVQDGCNARAFIQLGVQADPGIPVFLDRLTTRFCAFAPGMPASLAPGAGAEEAALLLGMRVFEPMHDAVLYGEHDELHFYTWGDTGCCLPKGATEATLLGSYPKLQVGDVLIFQEMIGPKTGNPADADVRRRCAVRLTGVATKDGAGELLIDPLFKDLKGNPIQVTEIQWTASDALPFPLCISSTYLDAAGDRQSLTDVSVAFGNVVLADHGLTIVNRPLEAVPSPRLRYPPDPAADRCQPARPAWLPTRYRPAVPDRPITQAVPLATVALPGAGAPSTTGLVKLAGTVVLDDANGFACLRLNPTDPAGWPAYFGVRASPNAANPANFDLTVVYSPPGGAGGIHAQVAVEKITNLSLAPADPNFVAARVNASSSLLAVPSSYAAPAGPLSGFVAAPTMLSSTTSVDLVDLGSPPVHFLTLVPRDPPQWRPMFGITAQPTGSHQFDLAVVYDPAAGGVGVALPVTVERFAGLTLDDAAGQIAASSSLIRVQGFAQAPDASLSAHQLLNVDPRQASPAIALVGTANQRATTWTPKRDLLESGESDPAFAVEMESDGTSTLRFGDDVNGKAPESGTTFVATYRIGNGTAGNVGADSLTCLAVSDARIKSCRNPLPATGGADPETADQVRRRAPQAFVAQQRAVTMADYDAKTELNPQVARAAASLRWTGSWYTVFVATEPKGGGDLAPDLRDILGQELEPYRLAGQDLEFDSPQYVSLEIALNICVDPDYFRTDVEQALQQILSNRVLADGRKGVFHPDNFAFGQTVYLSPIYAAARSVAGVVSVAPATFQPQGVATTQYLDAGEMKLGPLQVARLDNDRNFPNHGQLTLVMEGGK